MKTKHKKQTGNKSFKKLPADKLEPREIPLGSDFYLLIFPDGVMQDNRPIPVELFNPGEGFIQKLRWPGNYVAISPSRREELVREHPGLWKDMIRALGNVRHLYFQTPLRRRTYLTHQPDTDKDAGNWVKLATVNQHGLIWHIYERWSRIYDGKRWTNFKVVLEQAAPMGTRRAFSLGWNGERFAGGKAKPFEDLKLWVPEAARYIEDLLKGYDYTKYAPSKRDTTAVYYGVRPPAVDGWTDTPAFEITTSYEDHWHVYLKRTPFTYSAYRIHLACTTGRVGRANYAIGWSANKELDFDSDETREFKKNEPELFDSVGAKMKEFLGGGSPTTGEGPMVKIPIGGMDPHKISRRKYLEKMKSHPKWVVNETIMSSVNFVLFYYAGETLPQCKKNVVLVDKTEGAPKYKYQLFYDPLVGFHCYHNDYKVMKKHKPKILAELERFARKTSTFDHL